MRFPLYFKDVKKFIPVNDNKVPLPRNIAVASGADRREKYSHAVSILRENPVINAVVVIESIRQGSFNVANDLYGIAKGGRLRASFDIAQDVDLKGIFNTLQTYVSRRNHKITTEVNALAESDIQAIKKASELWEESLCDSFSIPNTQATQSVMAYVPEYGNDSDGYVNTHVDHSDNMDVRIVEVPCGSGTVLCADDDFEIYQGDQGGNLRYGIRLTKTKVNCWSILTGSSVVIRGPSPLTWEDGARPCVHAHGVGGQENPEQRMTFRHDLVFS